jgi:ferredoxin-NADP reductase
MHKVIIKEIEKLNHDVRRFVLEKPADYTYEPGQATMVAINKDGEKEAKRPFTFSGLPDEPYLEFVIKIFPGRDGVTDSMDALKVGESLIIEDPWGAIEYKGPGVFIAGGTGITPLLAILRDQALKKSDAVKQLIFSNETQEDLFLIKELAACTSQRMLLTFTGEAISGAESGRVDKDFLQKHVTDFNQYFYVCGPPKMVEEVEAALKALGADADKIVTEGS